MIYWHEMPLDDWYAHRMCGDFFWPYRQYIRKFTEAEFTPPPLEGRGVIIPAGGSLLPGAWVTINLLRQFGCALPIEIWHLGPDEMPDIFRKLIEPMNARAIDARALLKDHPSRALGGWELKPYALILSHFAEVLLLDADNHPTKDPTYLFNAPEFKAAGAVFWPDRVIHGEDSALWDLFGVEYRREPAHETGQILMDKRRHWKALQLAMHCNEFSGFHYSKGFSHGDTATFRFSFHVCGERFAMAPQMIAVPVDRKVGDLDALLQETTQRFALVCNATGEYIDMPKWGDINALFLQRDFAGDVIFQHRSGGGGARCRFTLGENRRLQHFQHEQLCFDLCDELRAHLEAQDWFSAQQWIEPGKISPKRAAAYSMIFKLAAERGAKRLVETGTFRWANNWEGDGGFTYWAGKFAQQHGARLVSVDIDPKAVRNAEAAIAGFNGAVEFHVGDSVEYLKSRAEPIDLLYLDALGFDAGQEAASQQHTLKEAMAALPRLHAQSIVAIDDYGLPGGGKGGVAVPFLQASGWEMLSNGYVAVLVKGVQ